jgi:hypothetical protein
MLLKPRSVANRFCDGAAGGEPASRNFFYLPFFPDSVKKAEKLDGLDPRIAVRVSRYSGGCMLLLYGSTYYP